jgi:Domain of Unknown Function (DUF1080)
MKKIIIFTSLLPFLANAQKNKWVSLFDGKNLKDWHIYNSPNTPIGWEIINGELTTKGKSGDIVTDKEYEDFEMEFEFKIPPTCNSGVLYRIIESPEIDYTYKSGPEYQIIDDNNYPHQITDSQKTAANYDMHHPNDLKAVKPIGEWNKGRIVVKNNKIEHWLNDKKVVDYTYGNEIWKAKVAESKFAELPYAKAHTKGKISLQDHGKGVWFRNIRIREL